MSSASNTMLIVCVSMMLLMICAPLRACVGYLCVPGLGWDIYSSLNGIWCGLLDGSVVAWFNGCVITGYGVGVV